MIAIRRNTAWPRRERATERSRAAEVEFGLPEVLELAEEIETRRLHQYLRMMEWFEDSELRGLCRWLAGWSRERVNALARRRRCIRPADPAAPHSQVLAGLAFFAAEDSLSNESRTTMTKARLLRSEIDRSRRAIVFYQGLKGFTRDETAEGTINEIIGEECHCLAEMVSAQAHAAPAARR